MQNVKVLLIVLLIAFVSGCAAKSEDDWLTEIVQVAETTFEEEKLDVTVQLENFSLYLPNKFEVVEESTSNLILQKGEQVYILFQNPLENSRSDLNYQSATENNDYILLQSFKTDNKFGFVMVSQREDEEFELQIGVGGVKLTTISESSNLTKDVEAMMKMANSLEYSSKPK